MLKRGEVAPLGPFRKVRADGLAEIDNGIHSEVLINDSGDRCRSAAPHVSPYGDYCNCVLISGHRGPHSDLWGYGWGQVVHTFEGKLTMDTEDGGMALIGELEGDDELFVRIQSWDKQKKHPRAKDLNGKVIRVTIEVVDDE